MAKARRTTHRSTAGKKLYAVRDGDGRFKDIQMYERAHRADLAKSSKKEVEAKSKKDAKAAAPAAVKAKPVVKKAAPVAKKAKAVAKKATPVAKKAAATTRKTAKKR